MARASSESAIGDALVLSAWRSRPGGCRPDAAEHQRALDNLNRRAAAGIGMNAADSLADAEKKVAAYEEETSRIQEQRRTCYVDPDRRKMYQTRPQIVAALTAEASA